MAPWIALLLFVLGSAIAQQIYIPAAGTSARPQCTATPSYSQPTYSPYSTFAYSMTETVRTATSVQPGPTTTLGHGHRQSLRKCCVDRVMEVANPPNFTETSVFSTTVSPTPIPTSELVLPPPDYFGPTDCYYFPADFQFGVAGSAAQIEGATADEGKSPSLMDILIQDDRPKDYATNENYYYYKQEIERLASMGVKYYSFSLAWSRILPFALPGTPVNQQGLDHYSDLIDFVLEKGMIPVVTILHFDTPAQFFAANFSAAQAKPLIGYSNGGYQNETFVEAYVNYAKIVMTHYADRVPIWFTFNEPFIYAFNGLSVDHVIKAHAQVYHFYKESIKGTGKISLKFNDNFGVPRDPANPSDVYAADHFNSFQLGMFCHPIFLGLDYPESYKRTVPDYVPLNSEDLAYINGTADFLGIDPYTATVVSPPVMNSTDSILECCSNTSSTYFPYCVNQSTLTTTGWNIGYRSQSYVYIAPRYLRLYLSYLYNTFHSPIVITEFGFPVFAEAEKTALSDQLYDTPRSIYYLSYMTEVLKSIWEDGVPVVGAFAWSFADNWEFGDYGAHFGLQAVNRTTQARSYKKAFFDLVDFVSTRAMPQAQGGPWGIGK
ncbi:beta-glucosidase [Cladophialophora psammophila CBS 110553]|uniref:Beta-glucosidase n=1 Tax=Cladophialophora psammophila CBS 110553 TaxID=1182543 RepID=W9XBM9_9EURO|nr:beta-glucosidase [Cladophialophora psammophila CBS 110553]EXJ74755.1 beta-glucosidase [Cladophialophora psammophila CBS 110553]